MRYEFIGHGVDGILFDGGSSLLQQFLLRKGFTLVVLERGAVDDCIVFKKNVERVIRDFIWKKVWEYHAHIRNRVGYPQAYGTHELQSFCELLEMTRRFDAVSEQERASMVQTALRFMRHNLEPHVVGPENASRSLEDQFAAVLLQLIPKGDY